jgi:putative flippase GtrA
MRERIDQLPDIQKQLVKFFIIGVFATLVDLFVYYILLQLIPVFELDLNLVGEHFHPDNRDLSKSCSFIIGSLVTYNLNKYWTWKQHDRSHKRFAKFYTLYGASLVLNVLANKFALHVLTNNEMFDWVPKPFLFAFGFATGVSAVFNFAGQKLWVFSVKDEKNEIIDGDKHTS